LRRYGRAIADYLAHVARRVRVEVEQVVLTAGTQHSLDLLCAAGWPTSATRVWMEEPGYWGARAGAFFEACDLKIEPVAVDAERG